MKEEHNPPHFTIDDHAILWVHIVNLEKRIALLNDRTKWLWRVVLIILTGILGLYFKGV